MHMGATAYNIERWLEQAATTRTWQQRTSVQGKKMKEIEMSKLAGQAFRRRLPQKAYNETASWRQRHTTDYPGNELEHDCMKDLTLKPGVAVVYRSALRYDRAPEEALTIDMFDATLPLTDEVLAGGKQPRMTQRSQELHTSMVFEDEIPEFLVGKMGVLRVTLQSLRPEKCDPGFLVAVPEVGVAYATGAFWILITEDDLKGTPWEERDAP